MSFKNALVVSRGVDPVDYHNVTVARGDAKFPMSPSALKVFSLCPSRWVGGYQTPGSGSMVWGKFLDCMVLTPELVSDRYAVTPDTYAETVMRCPSCGSESSSATCRPCKLAREQVDVRKPWNGHATVCREWAEKMRELNMEVVPGDMVVRAQSARDRLLADDVCRDFIESSDKQVLVEGEWHDEATGVVVPVRCLMDLVPRMDSTWWKCLGDMKTSTSGAVQPFCRQLHRYGWHIQAAFDTDLYVAATGEDRNTWVIVGQENYEPWQTFKRMLSIEFMEVGRADYVRALKLYARCLKEGRWPDYDSHDGTVIDGMTLCVPEPWMGGEFQSHIQMPDGGKLVPAGDEEFDTP